MWFWILDFRTVSLKNLVNFKSIAYAYLLGQQGYCRLEPSRFVDSLTSNSVGFPLVLGPFLAYSFSYLG
jgi:hypothetical protein